VTENYPEKSKAGLEEMEVAVVAFEEGSDKVGAADFVGTLKPAEAAVERQELRKEEANVTISSH
jgi:hypothetical protein